MQSLRPAFRVLRSLGFPQQPRRTLSFTPQCFQAGEKEHPVLREYRDLMAERSNQKLQQGPAGAQEGSPTPQRFGDLADNSIFRHPGVRADLSVSRSQDSPVPSTFEDVDADALANVLDPQPRSRQLWERRQAVRIVRRRGRLTKKEHFERTERSMMINSPLWDTSIKKLMPLARQISGKTIEDAIIQMHFSKKVKNGKRMKEFLEFARNKAMASMGMGLGLGNPSLTLYSGFDALDPPQSPAEIERKMAEFVTPPEGPVAIKDKLGNKMTIEDPSGIYLARVWVVRGPYSREVHFRSRHRATYLNHPSARLFMILKEETTRIREAKEREARKDKRKPWVQLEDRPISAQHQHLLW